MRQAFPALELTDVAAKLDVIGGDLRQLADPPVPTFNGIPTSPDEQRLLTAQNGSTCSSRAYSFKEETPLRSSGMTTGLASHVDRR